MARRSLLFGLLWISVLFGCDDGTWPTSWEVHVSPEAPEAVRIAAADVETYLGQMGQSVERRDGAGEIECAGGRGHIVFVGDGLSGPEAEGSDQAFRYEEQWCGSGRIVYLSGGGLLGRQYAAYEWLHSLGVRYFHPEQEFVPDTPGWFDVPRVHQHEPSFRWRSVSLHLTHPLELGDAFRLGDERYFDEARRFIDWQIKNGASHGTGGYGTDEATREYGIRRGFLRTAGLRLYGTQQGATAILDPDDPRSDIEQIMAAIEERMGVPEAQRPQLIGVAFDPSEFTQADDQDVVRQLTFIADYLDENYPGTMILATNHGTHSEVTPHYGVRYYDLPQFAPSNLGVTVHPLMFYDLFRPAPVYGNENFNNLYDFMEQEHTRRSLWYFPEAAWWLTFDNAVPLYLPITVEARDRDIQGIRHMLDEGLDAYAVFCTGHEWGYWQNEYCPFRMSMDVDFRWTDCFADITGTMGEAAEETQAVLVKAVEHQQRDMFDADILAYLVGTDPETEVAASIGIQFHPLPPSPDAILRWDGDELDRFDADILPRLQQIDTDFSELTARLDAVRRLVPAGALPFFDEIRDGMAINAVRARHQWQSYGAMVMLRRAQLTADDSLAERGEAQLTQAEATTQEALRIVHQRERGYRYQPLERSIGGGPAQNEDDNWTIYGYRYLNRTHHGYYYTRIDDLMREAAAGAADPIVVEDALLGPDEALLVQILDGNLSEVTVDYGDGSEAESGATSYSHSYAEAGFYTVTVTATRDGMPLEQTFDVAALTQQWSSGFTGRVVEPMGASLIDGVLPGVVWGTVTDTEGAVGFATVEEGSVHGSRWIRVRLREGGAFGHEEATLVVPVVNRATGAVRATLPMQDASLSLADGASVAEMIGSMASEDIVQAIVSVGGFEPNGARAILASTLGYTPETLPTQIPFQVDVDAPDAN